MQSRFLNIAHRIGWRLVDQALWERNACTWEMTTSGSGSRDGRRSILDLTSGVVYQGTAGVALFLGELYKHTQDDDIRKVAEGAIRHSLRNARKLSDHSFGFYNGRVGVAYTAIKVGRQFGQPQYQKEGLNLLAPLFSNVDQDRGLDVIAGAAGSIPALLEISAWMDAERFGRLALSLGEFLIRRAFYEPIGWSWRTMPSIRHLNGYAHGASGIGHAFLELYHTTCSDRYRYAAEQAFLYERQFFNREVSNWPDLRYRELSKYRRVGQSELQAAVRNDELSPPERTYMSAWCHGAPGIGLVRLRGYDLLGHDKYAKEARAALEATKASLDPSWNYSLCHGIGGNCETLLYGASVLEEPSLREFAEAYGDRGKTYAEGNDVSWPCGTVNAASDPGLMLGEAGIGYFYLRLFSNKTPSCLFLRAPHSLDLEAPDNNRHSPLQRDYVATFFDTTLKVLGAWNAHSSPDPERPISDSMSRSDVQSFKNRLENWISQRNEPAQSMLADASCLDRTRFELQKDIDNFAEETIEFLRRPAAEEISWESGSFDIAPHAQIIEQEWAWEDWLATSAGERPDIPEESRSAYLLYRLNNRIRIRELGSFAELILRGLKESSSRSELVKIVRQNVDPTEVYLDILRQKITEQLVEAYKVGAIRYLENAEVTN